MLKNIDCGQSLEPPCRGDPNEYLQPCRNIKIKMSFFFNQNFQFLEVKFSIYLNRRVFCNDVI